MNIGRALDICLERRRMSKSELARLSTLSKSYLTRLTNNERVPNLETLEKICHALNVPLSIFIFLSSDNSEIENISQSLKDKMDGILQELLEEDDEIQLPK
ncbi:helix-turn-helix domain-containing protein [Photorhabdus heterorhabditis]|uniref:helix-turn-helix domain-containing protein n=1 Tax=Photorhabdus heterorhabditis TaxID=880156 RepID=UPI0015622810|nr:helix-turn-helix transcriptional regulator [Photorhabdus heterorhabditis]NRN27105.1 helix-turn-helix transcriptional regulator [Photorhabdus heterorhabditis subsp. aluminescens]